MSLLQQLQLASILAEDKNIIRKFNVSYVTYREKKGIKESMINALRDHNLYEEFNSLLDKDD